MAITINWATRVISIPKVDTPLVVAGPPEIRELDLDVLRLRLKDLEDDEDGMPFPDTHTHNTEYTISGTIYTRAYSIINGYTVTFEDGQYAVRLFGANCNLEEVTNVNQVSIRSANSAGLVTIFGGASLTPTQQEIRDAMKLAPSAGSPGAASIDEKLDSVSAKLPVTLASDIRQILRTQENRLEVDLVSQELILYDDDGITPLRRWPLETDGGENITTSAGVQTRRKKSII